MTSKKEKALSPGNMRSTRVCLMMDDFGYCKIGHSLNSEPTVQIIGNPSICKIAKYPERQRNCSGSKDQ